MGGSNGGPKAVQRDSILQFVSGYRLSVIIQKSVPGSRIGKLSVWEDVAPV